MAEAANKEIMDELKSIKKELSYIKKHMVEEDNILTEEDLQALQGYREQKKKGTLTSHAQLKKELGI